MNGSSSKWSTRPARIRNRTDAQPPGLDEGQRLLEVGTGSAYGAAVAREVVGPAGVVVSVEIDPATFEFAKRNLEEHPDPAYLHELI